MIEIRYINGMMIYDADYDMTEKEYWAWIAHFRYCEKWDGKESERLPQPVWAWWVK